MAYFIEKELPNHEYFGEEVRNKLIYYPTVTREHFRNQGRLTDLINSDKLYEDIALPTLNPTDDRVMICGSPQMLADTEALLGDLCTKPAKTY